MRFWDSSAVIPLLVGEATTPAMRKLLRENRRMHVWWGTEVECVSSISRLEREGVDARIIVSGLSRLKRMAEDWSEIVPGTLVRDTASRLLRVHPLRAADALQLAAAWVLADGEPASVDLLSLDDRLRDAASREGFAILPEELAI